MNYRISFLTLLTAGAALLSAALLLTDRPDGSGDPLAVRDRFERELEQKLQSRVSVWWEDVTLSEACRRFAGDIGLPLKVTRKFREWNGDDIAKSRVTIRQDDIRRIDLLGILQTEMQYFAGGFILVDVQRKAVILATEEPRETRQAVRLHPIPPEVFPTAAAREELIETILVTVEPEGWQDNGGEGMVELLGTALLVKNNSKVQRTVADLLDGFRRLDQRHGAIEPILVGGSPDDEKIWRALWETTDLSSKTNIYTMPQLVAEIRRRGIRVHLFGADTSYSPKQQDEPLRKRFGRDRLELLLKHLDSESAHYCFSVKNGSLLFTDEIEGYLGGCQATLRLYPVGDLVQTSQDCYALSELLREMIEPDCWMDYGGDGQLMPLGDNVLICRQSYQIHRKVEQFLGALRHCRIARPRRLPVEEPSEAAREIERQLEQPLPLVGPEPPISLEQLVERLHRWYGLDVAVSPYIEEECDVSSLLFSPNQPDEKLGDYLTRQLDPYDLMWYVEEGTLGITIQGGCGFHFAYMYDARPFLDGFFADIGTEDIDDLLYVLQEMIEPGCWLDNGGEGQIEFFNGYLVISQPEFIHKKIARLQDELAAGDLHRLDEYAEALAQDAAGYSNYKPPPPEKIWQPVDLDVSQVAERYRFDAPMQIRLSAPGYAAYVYAPPALHPSPDQSLALLLEALTDGEGIQFKYTASSNGTPPSGSQLECSNTIDRISYPVDSSRWTLKDGRLACRLDWPTTERLRAAIEYLLAAGDRLPRPGDLFGPGGTETVEKLLDILLDADAPPLDRAYADFLLSGYLYAIPEANRILSRRLEQFDPADRPDVVKILCRLIASAAALDSKMLQPLQDVWHVGDESLRYEVLHVLQANLGSPQAAILLENMFDTLIAPDPNHLPSDLSTCHEVMLIHMIYSYSAVSDGFFEKILHAFAQTDQPSFFYNAVVSILQRFDPTGERTQSVYLRWSTGPPEQRESARRLRERLPGIFDEND